MRITPETHRHLGWNKASGFAFARHLPFQALAADEIARIAQCLPVGFRREAGRWQAVALLAPVPDENRFVTPLGKWRVPVVPAALRVYPFCLDPEADDTLSLWPDVEPLPIADAEHPFFVNDVPGPVLIATLNFLRTVHTGMISLRSPLNLLEQADCLTPWPLPGALCDDARTGVGDICKINEMAFAALDDTTWLRLRRLKAIGWIHAHLASQHHAGGPVFAAAPPPASPTPPPRPVVEPTTDGAKAFLAALSVDLA